MEKTHVINGQSLAVKKALPKEQTVSGQQKFNKANFNDNNNNVSPRRGNNRYNNANNNYNENYYNNNNNNNDYSDDFNFNQNGFNNFSNNLPNYQNQQRMPSNDMQNNFNNFALLAQKMLQASFLPLVFFDNFFKHLFSFMFHSREVPKTIPISSQMLGAISKMHFLCI